MTVTDTACLRDAQRLLADHRATRPATTGEIAEITARHRATERALLDAAAELRETRIPTAAERGHGPHAVAEQHAAAIVVSVTTKDALHLERDAGRARSRAEAWERILRNPGAAWLATEAEYVGRVRYYGGLLGLDVGRLLGS